MLRGKQRVPLDLRRLDLLKQQFEPIEFTADLSLEMLWQGTAIACPQLIEPSSPIATQRLVLTEACGLLASITPFALVSDVGPFVKRRKRL